MPTPQDAQAILARAQEAAQRAESAAEQLAAARTAAGDETRQRFPDIPEEVLKTIADASATTVVEALRAEFELGGGSETSPPAEPGPPADGAPPSSASTPTAEPADPPPAGAARKSIAQRILGQ